MDLNRAIKSRTVVLNAVARDARVEDLIRLAVKGQDPLMTGSVKLRTDIDIPESNSDLIDRLKLKGHFTIENGQFYEPGNAGESGHPEPQRAGAAEGF